MEAQPDFRELPALFNAHGVEMKVAYFDCFAGAAGDMIVAALLDAGLDLEALRAALATLDLGGYEVSAEPVRRGGLAATRFNVAVESGAQPHRHLADIQRIINAGDLPGRSAERALAVFARLASAEAKVHGVGVEEVHFHEVGAVDSIVDVVGAAIGLELLGVERVFCSPIPAGSGTVETAHGTLPVPAPATAALLVGAPVAEAPGGAAGELTTPTGAAVLTTLAAGDAGEVDAAVELSANLDDCTGEVLGAAIGKLLAGGALDAWAAPVVMKKSRPAWMLSALCEVADAARMEEVFFTETTTLGVRRRTVARRKLARRHETVETPYGAIRVKVAALAGRNLTASPEFAEAAAAAEAHGVAVKEVLAAAVEAHRRKGT